MNSSILATFPPSGGELMVIAILVLVLFGAKKLPIFARSLGRSMGEFRKAKEEFEQELNRSHDEVVQNKPASPRIEATPTVEAKPAETATPVHKEA